MKNQTTAERFTITCYLRVDHNTSSPVSVRPTWREAYSCSSSQLVDPRTSWLDKLARPASFLRINSPLIMDNRKKNYKLGVHWIQNVAIRPDPNLTAEQLLLSLHHNSKKLEWLFTPFCDRTYTWVIISVMTLTVKSVLNWKLKWAELVSFRIQFCIVYYHAFISCDEKMLWCFMSQS